VQLSAVTLKLVTYHGGASPGWYDDGTGSGAQRWWDGQRWTEHRSPGPPQPTQYPGGAYAPGALHPQPAWAGYPIAAPARRRRSWAFWVWPLLVAVVLIGGTVWYQIFGGSHTDWYQEGYDVGKEHGIGSSRFIDSGPPESECTILLVGQGKYGITDSHGFRARELMRGCVQAIKDKNDAKRSPGES
jgi:hypothetical protein